MARTHVEGEPWQVRVGDRVAEAGLLTWHLRHLVRNAFILGAEWVFNPTARRRGRNGRQDSVSSRNKAK